MDISRHDAGAPPARTHTAATLYHLFREACRCGMSPRELHSATGITPESLSDFDRRVSAEQLFHAWEQVMRRLREPELPVRVARRTTRDPRSPLTHLAMASSTVRQALERAARFGAAFTTVYAIHLEPWPDGVAVVIDGLGTARLGERCEAEFELADFLATGRAAVGRVVVPQRVTFAHRAPRAVGLHRRHFGAGLRFGGPRTELVISAATLSLPLRAPRPGLAAYLESSLERSGAPAPASFTLRTRAALAVGMADGELTIDHVARELHLSARTLHRRLAEEGTAFRRVLDETRHSRALALLGRPELPTAAVAEQLGFSSTRSFDRAFARWTGTSPRGRRRPPRPDAT
jgi:AraC-like DNA-binding protein